MSDYSIVSEDVKATAEADLARSDLSIEDIQGCRVLNHVDAKIALRREDPIHAEGAYTIPYFDLDGNPIKDENREFLRVRLLKPHRNQDARYLSPAGSSSHIYIPQQFRSALEKGLDDFSRFVVITEGEKKAIAGCKYWVPTLAIPGITMFLNSKGATDEEKQKLLPELRTLLERLRDEHKIEKVVVLFDSDGEPLKKGDIPHSQRDLYAADSSGRYIANQNVHFAAVKLAQKIRESVPGLKVAHGWVSSAVEGTGKNKTIRKRGLDDFIIDNKAAGGQAYRALIAPMLQKAFAARSQAAGGYLPLGLSHDHNELYIWSLTTDSLVAAKSGDLSKPTYLTGVLGLEYLEFNFSSGVDQTGKAKIDTTRAAMTIADACQKAGFFSPEDRVRGCGVWYDKDVGGLVIARRDAVTDADGQPIPRMQDGRRHIYVADGKMQPPEYMEVPDDYYEELTARLIKGIRTWPFMTPSGALMVYGWLAAQCFLGALRSRPSIWLIAPKGTGKSTLLHYMHCALGSYSSLIDMAKDATPAGVRQRLGASSAPFLLDEMEKEGTLNTFSATQNMHGMLSLMRSAYSARGEVIKGTSDQKGKSYRISTSFAFGSISDPVLEPADSSRVMKIYLRKRDAAGAEPAAFTAEEARAFFWGTIRRYHQFVDGLETIKSVWPKICPGGEAREADTMGTLIAAAAAATTMQIPIEQLARDVVQDMAAQIAETRESTADGEIFLQDLCSASYTFDIRQITDTGEVRNSRKTSTIGDMIVGIRNGDDYAKDYEAALNLIGLSVKMREMPPYLGIESRSTELAQVLDGTRWKVAGSWVSAVKEAIGDLRGVSDIRFGKRKAKGYKVPLDLLPLSYDEDQPDTRSSRVSPVEYRSVR